jgi:hypothetical protein
MMRRPLLMAVGCLLALTVARAVGPLSATGWGEPLWIGNTADLGRGGAGLALLDSTRLSLRNPALFHASRLTRFQTGFGATRSKVGDGAANETFSSSHLDAQAVGLPLLWQGLHAGLLFQPVTTMDYLSALRTTDALGREVVESLRGGGGLSRAGLNLSRALPGGWRAGAELGVVFGSVLEEWKLFYPASAPPYDSWVQRRRSLLGFQPRLGLHWQARPELALGLTGTLPARADYTEDLENLGNDVDAEVASSRMDLPGEAGLGLAWNRGGWNWLLDLRLQDWSGVELPAGSRQDSPLAVALGIELPASREFTAPWHRRVSWRAGLRHEDWYVRQPMGTDWVDADTWLATLGLGVPLKAPGTWLDVALEAGRAGSGESGALQEDFLRVRLGFSARDLWFVRPTY